MSDEHRRTANLREVPKGARQPCIEFRIRPGVFRRKTPDEHRRTANLREVPKGARQRCIEFKFAREFFLRKTPDEHGKTANLREVPKGARQRCIESNLNGVFLMENSRRAQKNCKKRKARNVLVSAHQNVMISSYT